MNNDSELVNYLKDRWEILSLLIFAVIIIGINIPRIHFNLFWGDECYSIMTSMSLENLVHYGSFDAGSSPPFFYVMIFIYSSVLGGSPEAYQLVPLTAAIIMMVVSVTVIRKEYGFGVALLFMILCVFLHHSSGYITEARSYEWAALFVLLSYISLYKVIKTHEKKYYAYLAIFSLCGAYTHYYCILAIAFFYFVLLLETLYENKTKIKLFFLTAFVVMVGYLPWLIYAKGVIAKTVKGFWATGIPSIKDCMAYMFDPNFGIFLFVIMTILTVYIILRERQPEDDNKKISTISVWLVAGLFSIYGTIIGATIISDVIRPLLVARYLYPVSIIAWLLLSYSLINVSINIDMKKALTISLTLLFLMAAIPHCQNVMEQEQLANERTNETLATLSFMSEREHVLSDVQTFEWVVLDYYMPDVIHYGYLIDPYNLPEFHPLGTYYLFLKEKMNLEIKQELEKQNFGYVVVMEDAQLDYYVFNVYKLVHY